MDWPKHITRWATEDALPLWRELLDLRSASAESPAADANTLNNAAWDLLTHSTEELRDPGAGAGLCRPRVRSGGGRGWRRRLWAYLDTLALAQHLTGDTATAIETQTRAISLMPSEDADPEMAERLAEYETALADKASDRAEGGKQ